MVLGPIDFIAIDFPGNHFNGQCLRELHELVAEGTIRVIDLVLITKSQEGNVSVLELKELDSETSDTLAPLQAAISQMITRDDLLMVGEQLGNDSTAAVMLFENTWARKTKQAIIDANGRLLVQERIPHHVVEEALEDLAALGAPVQ
jgi:hypothetical protein